MGNQYQIELIPSDFEGNINNPFDCIGGRSFSRAVGRPAHWGAITGNIFGEEGEPRFGSYIGDTIVNMMTDVKVGDTITFKKL